MKLGNIELLRCPSCRERYNLVAHEVDDDELIAGALQCPRCGVVVPVADGFAMFTEPMLQVGEASPDALRRLAEKWFGSPADYRAYHRLKRSRGGLEIYAAFQPFNESTRAFEPFAGAFAAGLQPGDAILDPWCRSGWSAHWLAAAYPEQTVVALWEGDRSVLGYRGYAYWFSRERRPPNLEVMFVDPARALPFADGAFAAVYTLDTFHRFSPIPFAGELLRVARPTAPIVLAHLHLTNSEPDPYFDRGGRHWHGRDYQAWLDLVTADGAREGRIYSEAELFDAAPGVLPPPDPDTTHYNGFAILLPKGAEASLAPAASGDERLLVNPLFAIHLARRVARVEGRLHDGAARELLDRHPVYERRLPTAPVALGEEGVAIVALALAGCTLDEIASQLRLDRIGLDAWLAPLEAAELLRRVRVSLAGVALQRFHANQMAAQEPCGPLATLLAALAANPDAALTTSDGGRISGQDLHAAVGSLAAMLEARGLTDGARLWIKDASHPLAAPLVLAGLAQGLDVALGAVEGAAAADLIVGSSGSGALPFESDDGCASVADALMDAPKSALRIAAGGTLTLIVGGHCARLHANQLADAALSLSAGVLPTEPILGIAAFADLLACLAAFGSARSIMIR